MVSLRKSETPGPDESAQILTRKLLSQEPFFFIRYGDGALECINGHAGRTCDFEEYSPELGAGLLKAWNSVIRGPNTIVGDWQSASFDQTSEYARYSKEYDALVGDAQPTFVHFEALLLMRQTYQLVNFYRAVKADQRKKLFMGPAKNAGAAKMLGADFLETPMSNLFAHSDRLVYQLAGRRFDVLLYGCGMAGNIPVVKCWEEYPDATYIALGSAMDTLFSGKSRRQQLQYGQALHLFRELL